jgi:RimJ/RimL family protein N-acetyltransferase
MLELRPYCETDRHAFVALVTDESLMQHMGGAWPRDQAHARFKVLLESKDASLPCMRAAHVDGVYVGHAFLIEPEHLAGVEIGFIVARASQGQGLGTALARALTEFGFKVLGLSEILATVDEGNAASLRVLATAGFEDLGVRHDAEGPYRFLRCVRSSADQGNEDQREEDPNAEVDA